MTGKPFEFKKKGKITPFPIFFEKLNKIPYAVKYKAKNRILPAIIFKCKDKALIVIFRYIYNRGNYVRIVSEDKLVCYWKERKILAFTSLDEYMTEEEKETLAELIEEFNQATRKIRKKGKKLIIKKNVFKDKEKVINKIKRFLLKVGKRIGLWRVCYGN